jgi:hypothetical protein
LGSDTHCLTRLYQFWSIGRTSLATEGAVPSHTNSSLEATSSLEAFPMGSSPRYVSAPVSFTLISY